MIPVSFFSYTKIYSILLSFITKIKLPKSYICVRVIYEEKDEGEKEERGGN